MTACVVDITECEYVLKSFSLTLYLSVCVCVCAYTTKVDWMHFCSAFKQYSIHLYAFPIGKISILREKKYEQMKANRRWKRRFAAPCAVYKFKHILHSIFTQFGLVNCKQRFYKWNVCSNKKKQFSSLIERQLLGPGKLISTNAIEMFVVRACANSTSFTDESNDSP